MSDTRDASMVRVQDFREILIWPFRLNLSKTASSATIRAAVLRVADGLPPHWRRETAPLNHLDPGAGAPSSDAYAECVYFQPCIQTFLYHDPNALHLYRREDLAALEVEFGDFSISLSVERLNLYLFPATGNAVVALELGSAGPIVQRGGQSHPLMLSHVQEILEKLRRAYPPYWDQNACPGLSPLVVRWKTKTGDWLAQPDALTPASSAAWINQHKSSPVAAHWQAALPLCFAHGQDRWTQVVDERIPLMAWIAVDGAAAIRPGDWVRLAMQDGPGEAEYPYAEAFLRNFDERHCYDAFWQPKAGKTTRYLLSGYGFVAVGDCADGFFTSVIHKHMRRHYFQMGLIAHFQAAALQTLSERLSHSAELSAELSAEQSEDLQRNALEFTQRYWFPDVSNHIQGRELFSRWRDFLGTDRLYQQVLREAQDMDAFLNACAGRDSAREAGRLNMIAAVGLVLSVATGFLGMNVLVGDWSRNGFGTVFLTIAVFGGLAGAGLLLLTRTDHPRSGGVRKSPLRVLGGGLLCAAVGFGAVGLLLRGLQ